VRASVAELEIRAAVRMAFSISAGEACILAKSFLASSVI